MLRPVLRGANLREVTRVEGGLVNTTYRVALDAGDAVYALRVYAVGQAAFEAERRLLPALAEVLPVPDLLFADASALRCAHLFVVYRWIDGITLNECRKQIAPHEFHKLAEPLGRLAAQIAAIRPAHILTGASGQLLPAVRVTARLACAEGQLRAGLARERLGGPLADRLRNRLAAAEPLLQAFDHSPGLMHRDFGGRNILVSADADGRWEVSGVLDWEAAGLGAALWDAGSLFRYPLRYAPEFRERFASGYRSAQGELPHDWWRTARLLDATRLVDTLGEERELPGVFAECRDLIASMLAGCEGQAA